MDETLVKIVGICTFLLGYVIGIISKAYGGKEKEDKTPIIPIVPDSPPVIQQPADEPLDVVGEAHDEFLKLNEEPNYDDFLKGWTMGRLKLIKKKEKRNLKI